MNSALPIIFKNTKTTLPSWVSTVHERESRGIAYETATHFVHFYGREGGLWVVSTGLTATQAKQGTLADWAKTTFGAQDITLSTREPGRTVAGVWRPGISNYDDIRQGLSTTDSQRHAALQTVRLLLERLDELFIYIEPFAQEKNQDDFSKAFKTERHIFDYVFTDSKNERSFVQELDASAEVVVYAKLPRGFFIPTPVGNYNPDWAIAFKEGKVKHVYFVAETKGSLSTLDLRKIEECKIDCARKFFAKITSDQVKYDVVDSYGKLMELVQ
jgi:hypothetical protein